MEHDYLKINTSRELIEMYRIEGDTHRYVGRYLPQPVAEVVQKKLKEGYSLLTSTSNSNLIFLAKDEKIISSLTGKGGLRLCTNEKENLKPNPITLEKFTKTAMELVEELVENGQYSLATLAKIEGTGKDGKVLKKDIQNFIG